MENTSPKAIFMAVILTTILDIAAVGTANSSTHLPDCKSDSRCLLFEDLTVRGNWDEYKVKWQSFSAADMQTMINAGADVHAKNFLGGTPLHIAAGIGKAEVISVLVKAGADVHAKNNYGWTPLHSAALEGQPEVISVLVQAGTDVNAKDNEGWTPLHFAAHSGNAEVIPVLVQVGAYVNATNKDGDTPLDWAKAGKHWNAVRELEKHGAK